MKKITGQVIYLGPNAPGINGLMHSTIFQDGCVYESIYQWIKACPAIGEFFVPLNKCAEVRKQLNFVNRQMLGTDGKYVLLFKAVQSWLSAQSQNQQTGVKLQTHA